MVRNRRSKPTVLSAFTGVGGLDLGLERAKFETIGAIEIDITARRSIAANRPKWNLLPGGDIVELSKTLRPRDLSLKRRELDLLVGGPPCQPFSKAAQWSSASRQGVSDPRNVALRAFLDLAAAYLPRVILIENVPGFVTGRVSAFHLLRRRIAAIDRRYGTAYTIHHRSLDAADFGVPQRRRRVILVISRDGVGFEWPEPTHAGAPIRAWDAIGELRASTAPAVAGKWVGLLPSIPEGQNYLWHTAAGGGLSLFGARTRYWSFLLKLAKNAPAWTIPAQPGPATGPFHWDNRPLTIVERLRLQSFPPDWYVEGCYRSQVRQVGNATPPLLAEILGRAIGKQFFGIAYNKSATLSLRRKQSVPPATRYQQVPSAFRELQRNHAPHPGTGKGPNPRLSL